MFAEKDPTNLNPPCKSVFSINHVFVQKSINCTVLVVSTALFKGLVVK